MILIQPGRHAYNILTVLSIIDEFPVSAAEIFGPKRVIRDVIFKLRVEKSELYRIRTDDGTIQLFSGKKLIWKHGQGNLKSTASQRKELSYKIFSSKLWRIL